ncbi:MAG: hypothetical protein M3018_12345 [Actinomycetota bacterium]|nr:hypothetical protein [Actinomycetota bacterium]
MGRNELSRRRRLLILAICSMRLLIVALDATIVNVALPSIQLLIAAQALQGIGGSMVQLGSAPLAGATAIAVCVFAATGGFLFPNTLHLQNVRGLSLLHAATDRPPPKTA